MLKSELLSSPIKPPQLELEVISNNKTWEEAIGEDWRNKSPKEWKPGWEYRV